MTDSTYLIDEFVTVKAGEPFRLFKFGKLVKDGVARLITPELAAKFRLPHFRPPIKRGSHAEETPAGGHIVGLEVRDDGLYALPEWNEQGELSITNGDYRYHSPEVVWDGWLEDPTTGDKIEGPLIVGDALLHTPHLGEATALYSIEVIGGNDMTTHDDMVSVSTLDKIFGWFQTSTNDIKPEPEAPEPTTPQEDYEAQYNTAQAEVDQLTAEVQAFKVANERQERVDRFAAEFEEVEAVADNTGLFDTLADIPEEQANELMTLIKAIAEQSRVANLTEDVGDAGGEVTGDPTAAFDAAIRATMKDKGVDYNAAIAIVRESQPDVFSAYAGGQ